MKKVLFRALQISTIILIAFFSSCGGDTVDEPDVNEAEKPDSLPSYASLNLYNSQSPFNQKLDPEAEIDPNSDAYVQKLIEGAGSVNGFIMQMKQYSTTVYIADENSPRYNVSLPCGDKWELGVTQLVGVPIPDYATPAYDRDGEDRPVKAGRCGESANQDNNMVILDLANRCEYDFWQARKVDEGWEASWGNSVSMDSKGIYEFGLSTRGSGFAFTGGLIWPDELQKGEITHALVFSYPFTKSGGPVPPATESDGLTNASNALPEGARLRLNPELDLSSLNLSKAELAVAKALQVYGLILVDTGGDSGLGMYLIDPSSVKGYPYDGVLPDTDYPTLENIPLDELQVLKLPSQDADFQSKLKLNETDCAQFE